ncbi:MAG: transcription-repair coupling factor [Acidobacteria bacterium]|nr:transcription-repair coupling factor [Acidobacteriota bacterium]
MIQLKRTFEAAMESGALRQLAASLHEGSRVLTVSGTAGGAKALTIAKAILTEQRPAAVIAPSNSEAQNLAGELQFYFELLSPDPIEIVHLPALEVDPYRGLSPHPDISAARAGAIWQLLQDGPKVLVLSIHSAAVRLHQPQRFLNYCLMLKEGEEMSPDMIREYLYESGFVEDDPVTDPGEFSLRGGILDVFASHLDKPVRLEFFGDRIESIRHFDPDSQRSVGTVRTVEIIPMREYCFRRDLLRQWAEKVPSLWSAPFLPHLEEELALARQGEMFPAFEFLLPAIDPLENTIFDYLKGFRIITLDREILENTLARQHAEHYERFLDRVEAHKPVLSPEQIYVTSDEFRNLLDRHPRLEVEELNIADSDSSPIYFSSQTTRKYHGNIRELIGDLNRFRESGESIAFILSNLGRAERMNDILREYDIPSHLCRAGEPETAEGSPPAGVVFLGIGNLHAGFYLPAVNLRVLTSQDLFDESDVGLGPKKSKSSRRHLFISDFRDLKPGDYVVHIDHGIGLFNGLKTIGLQEGSKEFVLLTYQDDARLYVPVERLDLIQKYSSMGGTRPSLDRLGGTSWARTKSRIKKSMRDMAEELLKLYAQRQMVSGFSFSADTAWQREFEDAFEFELTRDQVDALSSVKNDMEASRPMDRLLCGDVGYGKTEVAMRAAFKAVMDGKQVAVLAPTTVLAFQHYNTMQQRFTSFPVRIQLLSRFRSPKEQKQVIEDLEMGRTDIVVGTHRLLSKDVAFKDLGLVVVDEEQRFGVTHKERLKALKTRVDVLTLTATPIPRTLNMALLGLRDMSTIETPPKNRLAIQTSVLKYSPDVIRSAIEMELARNGQVYFVHNRVETIHTVAAKVQQLAPQARLGIAHGQMNERELEKIMLKFVQDELDILVATTIIENGLDIPRANTLIVDRADLYGLSQLYQLRGRVGRSDRRAYAYLLVPSDETLSEVARKRLAAIREFSDLGTGFRVAALDLEIRGAGNLLGGEQHGHIETVGFDLYCQLLEHTVEELRGEKPEEEVSTSINLNMDIRIPEAYIADSGQRLRMYKRISSAATAEELDALRQEMVDRFGPYPEQVENLFRYAGLRQETLAMQIQSVEKNRNQIFFRFVDHSKVSAEKLMKLVTRNKKASFSPQGLLTLEVPDLPPSRLFETLDGILREIRASN